jgi:hypothetical protein
MTQERVMEELQNIQQKTDLAETSQDVWYLIDRIVKTLPNDKDLGEYIRKIANKEYRKTLK